MSSIAPSLFSLEYLKVIPGYHVMPARHASVYNCKNLFVTLHIALPSSSELIKALCCPLISMHCNFLNDQKQYHAKTYLYWNTILEILWVWNLINRLSAYKLGKKWIHYWIKTLKTASFILAIQLENWGSYLCECHCNKLVDFIQQIFIEQPVHTTLVKEMSWPAEMTT